MPLENLEKLLKSLEEINLSEEQEVLYLTDEPKIPNFIALPNDFSKIKYYGTESYGQGYHPNKLLSRIKSIAEFLERLCLDNPERERLIESPFKYHKNFIDPSIFCCYSEEQIEDRKSYDNDARSSTYLWFNVFDVLNEKRVLIPAQTIFLKDLFKEEFQLRKERISTGAAFGVKGTNRAFLSGLLEVIERDACIFAYLSHKELPRILEFENEIKDLEDYLRRYNLETIILDATSDPKVPTTICITLDRTGIGPAVEVGSASSLNYREAIYKSMLESIQCRRYARLFNEIRFPRGPPKDNEIFGLDERFVYWHSLERIKDLNFWIESDNKISFSSLKDYSITLEQILKELNKRRFNVFLADISLEEIKNNGFEVKKVIIPEMHPLYLDERAKSLYSVHYGKIKEDTTLKPHPLT
ncbi:MAG: YcaO-like family protein [Candidatus Pacearchaeota archaeon]